MASCGDYAKLYTVNGYKFFIDAEDLDRVMEYRWHRNIRTKRITATHGDHIPLATYLVNPPEGVVVDHINRRKWDNRRANLRLATKSQNNVNRPSKNKWRGVRRKGSRYQAVLTYCGRQLYLGYHSTPEQAAKAYDRMANMLFKEFAVLNFPEEVN